MPRESLKWHHETETALPPMFRAARTSMVAADELFGLSKLSELQSPGPPSQKTSTRVEIFSRGVNSCFPLPIARNNSASLA
jgi:hypothetical protein